jgi:hypothetical protein
MTTSYFQGNCVPQIATFNSNTSFIVKFNSNTPLESCFVQSSIALPPGHQWERIWSGNYNAWSASQHINLNGYICRNCGIDFSHFFSIEKNFLSPNNDKTHKWITMEGRGWQPNASSCQQCGMTKLVGCCSEIRCEDLSCDEKIIKDIIE